MLKSDKGCKGGIGRSLSWRDALVLISLLILVLLFFWKIAFTNLILTGLDVFTYFYPYRAYAAEALRQGHLPLWNPYLFLGVPFLANIQTAVFYPLNWLLVWLSPPKMVAWSILIHVFLAGLFAYLYARSSLGLGSFGAFVAASVFAFSGFIGAQVEHINQLNASIWLPLLLLLMDKAVENRRLPHLLLASLIVALQLLAGHIQSSYICLCALGVYTLLPALRRKGEFRQRVLTYLSAMALGSALAAVQLLPSWELSRLSIRSGGLPYREAVSFSLKPSLLPFSLLPTFGQREVFSEYVAYIGFTGLGLALIGAFREHRRRDILIVLAALGLFLAFGGYNPFYFLLYKLVPGFAMFRAPARWLYLYTLGMAMLAGLGADPLLRKMPFLRIALALLVVGELFAASRSLAYNRPTAPEAFSSLRTAPTHLLALEQGKCPPSRFLSISKMSYDPGDLDQMHQIFDSQLPPKAVYDLVVAAKRKEILAPNLPLLYKIPSVDGYDGGILPLKRYVTMGQLLFDEEGKACGRTPLLDGRLYECLEEVPEGRILSLLNVKYVITDKVYDVWIDDIYYDLSHEAVLGKGTSQEMTLTDLPDFAITSIGLVSHLEGAEGFGQGELVAQVVVFDAKGSARTAFLRAGLETAEGEYELAKGIRHKKVRVARHWRDNPYGNDYIARIKWGEALTPKVISIRYLAPMGRLHLRGLTLIDERTGTFWPLVISTKGHFKLVHSGDVKIYENLDVLPRAFVVHRAYVLKDELATMAAIEGNAFAPDEVAILAEGQPMDISAGGSDEVKIISYEPERAVIEVKLADEGYLILTDTYYPGWRALVDGQGKPIVRADLLFRAVHLPSGRHRIEFIYDPLSFKVGAFISSITLLGMAVSLARWLRRR